MTSFVSHQGSALLRRVKSIAV